MAVEEIKTLEKLRKKTDTLIALAGNPNVGKSSLFNSITGLGVLTANYSGKTVELNCGVLRKEENKIGVVDLPGIYSLETTSEDQVTAVKALFENKYDLIVYIIDSTNLARNLYLLLQLIELKIPIIAALNFSDIAKRKGLGTDITLMQELLGVTVVPISAVRGDGIDKLVTEILSHKNKEVKRVHKYSSAIEEELAELQSLLEKTDIPWPYSVEPQNCAPLLLEGNSYIEELIKNTDISKKLAKTKEKLSTAYNDKEPESIIIKERYGLAGAITAKIQKTTKNKRSFSETLWSLATFPPTGIPILLLLASSIIYILFEGGGWLGGALETLWTTFCSPHITYVIKLIAGESLWATVLNWGFNDGILAAICVGVPYVLIFYFILSFLEDTGYLNAAAFLLDKAMHFIGLHSKAFIPLSAAIGCSVPAVMGTRILSSTREKIIAISLIVIIACSARTAVIFGAVSQFIGFFWALSIFFINFAVVVIAGILLNKFTPGEPEGLVMEIFPLRKPHLLTVFKKTWARFADFLWIATPIVVAGSMVLGWLYETKYIWLLTKPLAPIFEDWLGLPAVAGITLLFAVLRKELALQFLVILASATHGGTVKDITAIMTPEQIYTFTLFNTLYMPCIATIAVMGREIGWKWTTVILASTLTFTIVFTGIVHKILVFFQLP